MGKDYKYVLVLTIINLLGLGVLVAPWFEEMNLLRFLIIGFLFICLISPLLIADKDE